MTKTRIFLGGMASSLGLAVIGISGVNAYGFSAAPTSYSHPVTTNVTQNRSTRLADTVGQAAAQTTSPSPVATPITAARPTGTIAAKPQVGAALATPTTTDAQVLARLATVPEAIWAAGGTPAEAAQTANEAAESGPLVSLVAYNIPGRDCGSYSSGGAADATSYMDWIDGLARGIAGRPVRVILEPDALAEGCVDPSLVAEAATALKAAGALVYLDAGNSGWVAASTMASRLQTAGIANLDGFSVNVSNFYTTPQEEAYGHAISALVGGKHFVIDTSRNGNGSNGQWCNPSGRALGSLPTTVTHDALTDAFLWIKRPGESDGACNGGPAAGVYWSAYALGLARAVGW